MYSSVCQALSGTDRQGGRAGDLWVVGRTALPHFSAVINLPRSCSGKKKKGNSTGITTCLTFHDVFVSLSDTSNCASNSGCHEWKVNLWPWFGQQRKFPALFLEMATCDFSLFVLSLLFQCIRSISSMNFNYLFSVELHKTDTVGNKLQSSTLQSYFVSQTGASTFDILLYFLLLLTNQS